MLKLLPWFFVGLCWDLFLGYGRVVLFLYFGWFCIIFLVCLLSGLEKCFLVARHLLAKIGTDVAILIYKSSLLWMDHILKWCCFFLSADSFIKRYSH
jgi:hypothetical protein